MIDNCWNIFVKKFLELLNDLPITKWESIIIIIVIYINTL